jgi:hypothetical protein
MRKIKKEASPFYTVAKSQFEAREKKVTVNVSQIQS